MKGPKRFEEEKVFKSAIGPGQYDPIPKFGENKKRFTLGSKHVELVDKNQAPHAYESQQAWKSNTAKVHTPKISQRVGKNPKLFVTPDGGQYEPHKPFGDTHQKMTMRGRPKDTSKNATPEFYAPTDVMTRSRTPATNFKDSPQRTFSYLVSPMKNNPSCQSYETLKPFGSENKNKMTFGGKPKWKPLADTPGPGVYNTNSSAVLPRTPSAMIKQDQMVYFEDPIEEAK